MTPFLNNLTLFWNIDIKTEAYKNKPSSSEQIREISADH